MNQWKAPKLLKWLPKAAYCNHWFSGSFQTGAFVAQLESWIKMERKKLHRMLEQLQNRSRFEIELGKIRPSQMWSSIPTTGSINLYLLVRNVFFSTIVCMNFTSKVMRQTFNFEPKFRKFVDHWKKRYAEIHVYLEWHIPWFKNNLDWTVIIKINCYIEDFW